MPKGSRSPHHHLTKQDWEHLLAPIHGTSNIIGQLAQTLQCGPYSIRNQLKKHGLSIDRRHESNAQRSVVTPPRHELFQQYTKEGETSVSVGRHYGVSHTTVKKWLASYHIPIKSHRTVFQEKVGDPPLKEELERCYANTNIHGVMNAYHKSQSTVMSWLAQYTIQPHSTTTVSSQEHDLFQWIVAHDPQGAWRQSDRLIISPLELDIYSPVRKLAIEYGSILWHSQGFGRKSKDYHRHKWELCRDQRIQLLTIFDSDSIDYVRSLLTHKLNLSPHVIYGRNTVVKRVDPHDAKVFHDRYHAAQNCHGAKLHYGLFSGQELVQVMSFSRSRFSSRYEWEILRLTNRPEYRVIGGASKLWHEFVRIHAPQSATTYADLRFGTGKTYPHLGFVFRHYSIPNYWYFHKSNSTKLFSRVMFQKHKLKKLLHHFDPNKTEWDNMQSHGYDRIFDCGNAVYTWSAK